MDDPALAFLEGTSLEASLDKRFYQYAEKTLPTNEFQKWSLFRYLKKTKDFKPEYLPLILESLDPLDYLSIAAWRAIQCFIMAGLLSTCQKVKVKELAFRSLELISSLYTEFELSDHCTLTDATAGNFALHRLHIAYSLILLDEPFKPEYYSFLGEHMHIFIKALLKLNDKDLNSRFVEDYIYDLDKTDNLVIDFVKHIYDKQLCNEKSLEILSLFFS